MAGEFVHGTGTINKQDRPVNIFRYDLPCKIESLLPQGSVDMDTAAIILDSSQIECNSCCASGTICLNMF